MNIPLIRSHILPIHIFVALLLAVTFVGNAQGSPKSMPFRLGEKLTYQARWGFIPAGQAILHVLPMCTINGSPSYHFMMSIQTSALVDLIYTVRNRQESFTDSDMTHSVLYKKRDKGKHPRDVIVTFDWEHHTAAYTNFGSKMNPVAIVPGSYDPLAMFFAIRLHELTENTVIEIPVTDGKKLIMVKATVSREEALEVAGHTFDTYAVEPDMERLNGVFKKDEDARLKIWFTADEKKIPVKIRSKVGIGSFVFDLVRMSHEPS